MHSATFDRPFDLEIWGNVENAKVGYLGPFMRYWGDVREVDRRFE